MLLATQLLAAACVSNPAPRGFLPDADQAQTDVHGGWIELETRSSNGSQTIAGELIAVSRDSVWVLTADTGSVVAFADVTDGRFGGWDAESGRVGGLTVAGMVSTISNGFYLIATMPLWAIVGGVSSHGQSRLPLIDLPGDGWTGLAPFARFPGGMPPGVEVRDLQPKGRR